MSSERAAPQTDALLIPFLNAARGSESESVLAQLLSAQAGPIIKGIIKEKLRLLAGEADLHGQDAEDVYSDVVAQILARLDSLRSNQSTDTIQDFRSYVATATFNACHQYLRRKYPQRAKLTGAVDQDERLGTAKEFPLTTEDLDKARNGSTVFKVRTFYGDDAIYKVRLI